MTARAEPAVPGALGARATAEPARPLRVEMVTPALPVAGMETMVAALARALRVEGHEVGLTCTMERGALGERLQDDGFRVSVVGAPGLATNVRPTALAAHFAAVAPDVVHVHSGIWAKAAVAARRAGVPAVVHTAHGRSEQELWFEPWLWRWAGRHTDAIVAVSRELHEYLVREVRLPAARVVTLVNGIDVRRFSPGDPGDALRRRHGIAAGAPLVGIVARLSPIKHHALLVDAFAAVAAALPDAHLVLVGDGELRAPLEAQVAARGLTGRVHFHGVADELPAIYRSLDVCVLSSHAEGTSMSLLEAMACGTPVLATAVGGTPALLRDGACGVLVPAGDASAFADALIALLRDAPRRTALAAAARAHVAAEFDAATMRTRYESLYRDVVARRGRGARPSSRP